MATIAMGVQAHAQGVGAPPDDTRLERQNARIGRIVIEVDDVFEREIGGRPYRVANALHIATRADTISEQLLFHTGDIYDRRVLDETERLLRAQRYLNAASIEPLAYHDDNTVDVVVRVHDVWTLSPGVSFGRKGGANSTRVELEDTNFLGLGKHISFARTGNVDRTAWRAGYTDPNVLGSWWQLSGAYADLSDGRDSELAIARPFHSLDSRWSFGIAGVDSRSVERRYSLGEVTDQFAMRRKAFDIGGGVSAGLQDGHTLRYLGGYRFQSREFTPVDSASSFALPEDRRLAYPWFGVEWLEDQYLETRNLDQIGRTEDLYLGRKVHVEIGAASTTLGSTRDALIANGVLQDGKEISAGRYLIGALAFNGRIEGGEFVNAVVDASTRYYSRHSQHRLSYASVTFTKAAKLDAEEQLSLGGDNGLRGYPLRYQAGTARALIAMEERFYTNWQPLRLVNVGAAVFFDAGRVWGEDAATGPPLGWLRDVGAGLRLGNARSGLGNVIHIDIAFPLDAGKGGGTIDRLQFLVETRRSF